MQNIPIFLAEAGMVLAKDIRRPDNPVGPPICGKGVELTAPLIMKLQDMGIMSLVVKGHPIWQEGDKTLDEQLAALDQRFSKAADEPLMAMLKNVYRAYIIKSMGGPDEQ